METKFVTSEDTAKHQLFFTFHFDQLRKTRGPVPEVCHYTTGDTLTKILTTGELWCTQISCLNDAEEVLYAIKEFKRTIEETKAKGFDKRFGPCLELIEERIEKPDVEAAPVYVSCFSSKVDDLSQWRGYSGSGGYALVFDTSDLMTAADAGGNYLAPVLYGADASNLMRDIVKWTERFYLEGLEAKRAPTEAEWADDFTTYWLERISYFAPMIKHWAFQDEHEWRMVHVLRPDDLKNVICRQRTSMMTRHLPLKLRRSGDKDSKLMPLKKILVGPTGNVNMSVIAVNTMLRSNDYPENVEADETILPYRPYL